MTDREKLIALKIRYDKLNGTEKNTKCPGVKNKVLRKIHKLEQKGIEV